MLKYSVTALAALMAGAGVTVAAAPAAAATAELKLAAADDTYVSTGRQDASFGADEKISVGREDRDEKLGFLRFVVPAGTTVGGALLKLVTVGDVTGKLTLHRVAGTAWSESSLTAQNAPGLGDVVGTVTPKADAADVTFDVSKAVTGPGTYSFALRSDAASITRFRSAESGTGPVLVVGTSTDVPDMPAEDIPPAVEDEDMPPPVGGDCVTDTKLVPSCGVLWGAAAGGFTKAPRDAELKNFEKASGRTAALFHTYHKGDEPFPTKSEMAMARDAAHPRTLLLNWKIAYGSSWARVARGDQDARIDKFAARVKSSFPEKFFLVLNHEPENDVKPGKGSGWEARDFAAMYRHTVERLRAKGVGNAINVMAYMGNERWMAQSWWADLYPGDDVVDWMGLDSYVSAEKGYYHHGLFGDLLDRAAPGGQGFYDWATTRHAGKPIMVAEWGVYHRVGKVTDKAAAFRSVLPELRKRPNIKAIVYFETKRDDQGDRDISIDSTKTALAAFRTLAADKIFDVKLR